MMQRRQFVQTLGAGSAVAGLGLLGGCAAGGSGAKVVVVGGGYGGATAAKYVRMFSDYGIDVTLVEPNAAFVSCPISNLVIQGSKTIADVTTPYDNLSKRHGVKVVKDMVTSIDAEKRMVKLASGGELPYDRLILSPGIDFMWETLPGMAKEGAKDKVLHAWKAGAQTVALRKQLEAMPDGGVYALSIPLAPYRCPPAPYERAFLIAEQMKQRGTKGKIILIDANPAPMPAPIAKPILNGMKSLYAAQIEYLPDTAISAVDMGKRQLVTSSGDVPFAHANLVLPMRAPALIRQAGLGERWANVNLPSFQSQADERIYVIGDSQGTPLPKSGHVAFGSGQQVAEAITNRIAGKTPAAAAGPVDLPLGICWANVTHKEAININVTSSVEPGQPPKLKFTVDPEHNARSGAAAVSWGNGMWKAMLG
jgi:NADH dehydrogenase FAD-containing subunit